MTIPETIQVLSLIGLIGGGIFGFLAMIKKTIKSAILPLEQKIDKIETKMMSRKSTQTVLAMQTRELVGMKRKFMPIIHVMKTFLSSKGIKINPKTGEYIGDLSRLYEMEEDDFINEIRIILDKDTYEEVD